MTEHLKPVASEGKGDERSPAEILYEYLSSIEGRYREYSREAMEEATFIIVGEQAPGLGNESGVLYIFPNEQDELMAKRLSALICGAGGRVQVWSKQIPGVRDTAYSPPNFPK